MKVTGPRSIVSYLLLVMNAVRYFMAVVLAATVILVAVALFVDVPGLQVAPIPPNFEVNADASGWTLSIPVSLAMDVPHQAVAPALGIEGAEIRNLHGILRFPIRRGVFFVGNCVLLIVGFTALWWLAGQLRHVLRTVRDGQPFAPSNASRVRAIGWIVIGSELVRTAVVFLENLYAARHFSVEGLHFITRGDLNVFAIVEGLIILVIAEVFRAGTRLDEEQSLTV